MTDFEASLPTSASFVGSSSSTVALDKRRSSIEIITLGAEGGRAGFVEALQDGEVWGSSGSVADAAGLTRESSRTKEVERDSVEFRRALVRIGDEMENQGIASEGSRLIGRVFQRGLQGDGT
jgi:hypothetical protein